MASLIGTVVDRVEVGSAFLFARLVLSSPIIVSIGLEMCEKHWPSHAQH